MLTKFFLSGDTSDSRSSSYSLLTYCNLTTGQITMYLPSLPLATQWHDVTDKRFCNSWTADTVSQCNDDLCRCTHVLDVDVGQVS